MKTEDGRTFKWAVSVLLWTAYYALLVMLERRSKPRRKSAKRHQQRLWRVERIHASTRPIPPRPYGQPRSTAVASTRARSTGVRLALRALPSGEGEGEAQ